MTLNKIIVQCKYCLSKFRISEKYLCQHVRCPHCKKIILIEELVHQVQPQDIVKEPCLCENKESFEADKKVNTVPPDIKSDVKTTGGADVSPDGDGFSAQAADYIDGLVRNLLVNELLKYAEDNKIDYNDLRGMFYMYAKALQASDPEATIFDENETGNVNPDTTVDGAQNFQTDVKPVDTTVANLDTVANPDAPATVEERLQVLEETLTTAVDAINMLLDKENSKTKTENN